MAIGAYTPLKGRGPSAARRTPAFSPPATPPKLTGVFTSAFASRSDDSTYLLDANFGNSLLLPNRNLDWGHAKLDLGGSFKLLSWLKVYARRRT
jgi:vitamin B12 transporter